jgi:type IV pilus biogenesis protein CpaD/CtpE
MTRNIEVKARRSGNQLRRLLLPACLALGLAGCATYDRTPRGAAPDDYN